MKDEKSFRDTVALVSQAVVTIRADAKENSRQAGDVECPKCKGRLKYTIARSNGHVWGKCETADWPRLDHVMTTLGDRVEHVRKAPQTRRHHCHWTGCTKQVPPAAWGCKQHWFMLPDEIRREIWRTYRKGQEEDGKPSAAYVAVALRARAWIAKNHPPQPEEPRLL